MLILQFTHFYNKSNESKVYILSIFQNNKLNFKSFTCINLILDLINFNVNYMYELFI
jgi:hypothetical protein